MEDTKNKKSKVFRSFSDFGEALISGTDLPPAPEPEKKVSITAKETKNFKDKRAPKKNFSKVKKERKPVRFDHNGFNTLKTEAREHYKSGCYEKAIERLTKAIDQALEYIKLSRNEGELKKKAGDLDGALKEYKEARKVFKKLNSVFYLRGISRFKYKDYSGSMSDFSMVLKYQPDHGETHFKVAQIKEKLGDFSGVIESLNRVLELNSENVAVYYKRGDIRFLKGDFEGGLDDYHKGLLRDKENPVYHYKKGMSLLEKGRNDAALKELDKAIFITEKVVKKILRFQPQRDLAHIYKKLNLPGLFFYLNRGEVKSRKGLLASAEKDFQKVLEFEPGHIKALLKRAEIKKIRHDYAGAILDYTEILKKEPGRVALYAKRASLRVVAKDWKKALEDYNRAIEAEPYNIPLYLRRGEIKKQTGDHEGAVEDFTKVIEFKPGDFELHYKRGFLLLKMKQLDAGIEDIKNALCLDKSSPETLFEEGVLKENQKKYREAIPLFQSAIQNAGQLIKKIHEEKYPEEVEKSLEKAMNVTGIHMHLGICLTVEELYDQAILEFSKVLEYEPENSKVFFLKARSKFLKNDLIGALKDVKTTLELDSKNDQAYALRAKIYEHRGNFDAALKDYNKALKLNKEDLSHQRDIGIFFYHRKLYEGALFSLQKVLEREKNDAKALNYVALIYSICPDERYRKERESIRYALRAIEIAPSPLHFRTLAICYAVNHEFENAVEVLNNALSIEDSDELQRLKEHFAQKKEWQEF